MPARWSLVEKAGKDVRATICQERHGKRSMDECSCIAVCLQGCSASKAMSRAGSRGVEGWCALLGVIQIRQFVDSR